MEKKDLESLLEAKRTLQRIKTGLTTVEVSASLIDSKYPVLTSAFKQTRSSEDCVKQYREFVNDLNNAQHIVGRAVVGIDSFIDRVLNLPEQVF